MKAVANGYKWDKLQSHLPLSSLLPSCAQARMSHLRTKRCQPPGFVCLLQLPLSTDGSKYLTLLISTPTTRSSSQALQLSATLFVSQFRKEFSGAVLAHFARMLLYVKMSGLSQQTQLFLTPQKVASGLQTHESFGGCHRILGSNHQSANRIITAQSPQFSC